MAIERLSDLTLEQLREIIREEMKPVLRAEMTQQAQPIMKGDLSDFPVDDLGTWPEHLSLRREDMYGDDER